MYYPEVEAKVRMAQWRLGRTPAKIIDLWWRFMNKFGNICDMSHYCCRHWTTESHKSRSFCVFESLSISKDIDSLNVKQTSDIDLILDISLISGIPRSTILKTLRGGLKRQAKSSYVGVIGNFSGRLGHWPWSWSMPEDMRELFEAVQGLLLQSKRVL